MHAAVIGTTVTTPDSKSFRLFVDEEDILSGATMVGGVPLDSLQWELSGSSSPAVMSFEHWDPPRAFNIPGHATVRFWDATLGDQFQGNVLSRRSTPGFATGRTVEMRAADASLALDRTIVTRCSFPAGLSDRAIIQGLCGQFVIGSDFTWNATDNASLTFIASTNASMPAMTFAAQTLRSALEQVAVTANADDTLQRYFYVDNLRRLCYHVTLDGAAAPYAIIEGAPAGGQANAIDLELVDDDSNIVTAVYVNGKNAAGSGWIVAGASISLYGWQAEVLDAPDSDTGAKKNIIGNSYLKNRRAPVRRGSFRVQGTTGWAPGQVVTITSTSLGLAAVSFDVKHVTVTAMTGTPRYEHTIEFGARRPGARRTPTVGGTGIHPLR